MITGLSSLQFTNNGTMNIPLAILEDGLLEMTESFSIILSNSQPGPPNVQLGIDTIVVFIVDNNIREYDIICTAVIIYREAPLINSRTH